MWAIRRACTELRNKGFLSSYSKSSGFQREVHTFSSHTDAKINAELLKNEYSGRVDVDVHDKEKMLMMMKERVYNAEKLYKLMKEKVYAPPLHRKRKPRKFKKIELPTHFAEVNYRTQTAVVFYKPNTHHIPLPKNHPLR